MLWHHPHRLPPAVKGDIGTLTLPSGSQVRYYKSSKRAGRPLVLLHSVNAAPSTMEMKPLFDAFCAERAVIALDLPGFGLSQRGPLAYSPALFANAIDSVIRELCQEPPDIVAFSLSSEFVARALRDCDTPCATFTAISPTGLGSVEPPGPEFGDRIARVLRLPGLGAGLFRLLTTRWSIGYFLGQAFVGAVPKELKRYAWLSARQKDARFAPFAFLSMGLFTRNALVTLYTPVAVPMLVIFDRDPNVNFDRLDELEAANPGVMSQRIGPSLGLPHWEQTEVLVNALRTFWSGSD